MQAQLHIITKAALITNLTTFRLFYTYCKVFTGLEEEEKPTIRDAKDFTETLTLPVELGASPTLTLQRWAMLMIVVRIQQQLISRTILWTTPMI